MKNILITGGAGFIGANFVRYLLSEAPDLNLINLDALTYAGSLDNLSNLPDQSRHHFLQGDICDAALLEKIFQERDIDVVVHFAAETHVDRSILGPAAFIRTNIQGTFQLLEAALEAWQIAGQKFRSGVRFHHVSTDEVYGSLKPGEPAFQETTRYAPNSPYAASKAAGDHLVRSYYQTYGLPATITNCSNNYGPYQYPEKLIPLMILNARQGNPLPIYGDGLQIRDWLYVKDHCRAVWKVIREGAPGETYHVGGDNQPSNLDIVRKICAILDEELPDSAHAPHHTLITHVDDRPGHDRRYAMDLTKIQNQLDWKPTVSLQDGLRRTIRWYLDHPHWVEKISRKNDYQDWVAENYQKREQS